MKHIIWIRYGDMYIIPQTMVIKEDRSTLTPWEFEKAMMQRCDDVRKQLIEHWLPSCADIFLEYKEAWRPYIPNTLTDSPSFIEHFFNCVNMLLSIQVRGLVLKSLQHFRDLFIKFKVSILVFFFIFGLWKLLLEYQFSGFDKYLATRSFFILN